MELTKKNEETIAELPDKLNDLKIAQGLFAAVVSVLGIAAIFGVIITLTAVMPVSSAYGLFGILASILIPVILMPLSSYLLKMDVPSLSNKIKGILKPYDEKTAELKAGINSHFEDFRTVVTNPAISYGLLHEPVLLKTSKRKATVSVYKSIPEFRANLIGKYNELSYRSDRFGIYLWLEDNKSIISELDRFREDAGRIYKAFEIVKNSSISDVPKDVLRLYREATGLWKKVNSGNILYNQREVALKRLFEISGLLSFPEATLKVLKDLVPPKVSIPEPKKTTPKLKDFPTYSVSKTVEVDVAPVRTAAEADVAVSKVKVSIGALRTDICWVIDNPAFFDNNSAVTIKLFELLAEWDDLRNSPDIERVKLSESIEEEFNKAKKTSENLGMDYLHGETKKRVKTASKLVHKAQSTNSTAEHDSLMSKAAEILSGIMDVILPKQAVTALEAYSQKQLTPNANPVVKIEEMEKVETKKDTVPVK